MPTMLPPAKPRLSSEELLKRLEPFAINRKKYPVIIAGIRGYYRDTMGQVGQNDRGIYDDAIFVHSPSVMASFNGNTDASKYRLGEGRGAEKGMAMLKAGCWYAHGFGKHKTYDAITQRHNTVTVIRDGKDHNYEDTGWFGINIHRGGNNTTGSEGCQTLHPSQWPGFLALVTSEAKRYHGEGWRSAVLPYALLE